MEPVSRGGAAGLGRFAALLVLLLLWPALSPAGPRGYEGRPCGFDMNRNGVVGEPGDCNVGDGVTLDPDGDGVAEDILYVDCNNGDDVGGDGSPANPFATIEHAFEQADGPADGAEDIVAFTGTCTTVSNYTPPTGGGVPGFYVHWSRPGGSRRLWPDSRRS